MSDYGVVRTSRTCERRKKLGHRSGHLLAFNYAAFNPDGADHGARFTIYTPADRESSEALQTVLDAARLATG